MRYSREQRSEMRKRDHFTTALNSTLSLSTTEEASGPIFFWREYEQPHGFLCQWYPSPFVAPQVHPTHVFGCAEQYMMYRKALVLASPEPNNTDSANNTGAKVQPKERQRDDRTANTEAGERETLPNRILSESKPGRQKSLARSVKFSRAQLKEWERIKFEVVLEGSLLKFSRNQELKGKLMATGDRELVEASPTDRTWGIGFAAEFAESCREEWGSNLLGKALMSVRESLKGEAEAEVEAGRT
ncbi:hypothetical protein KC332_g14352 [Hortaea werneckii]|uniref:NADAR domain-containing protein n=2 Tax=Hortaea werneckii TaxID=91943 RepID=A0A3M7I6V2_HORWE|nr:hypothetical protein KC358_g5395 [Hortaea werneckii]OTA34496.1 hypothetical protein BTJ68_04055 [Hortaea werneckii EXF-2000]KAI6841444.1 hypothetical protein KC350_g5266 [Hortaea werneckii]KAI6906130.1 hypothetical protein KC348_g14756 [Hortaea werneckii]KAI6939006.1 hypothetical protein KC341_g4472 [Hortaea werneckii]